MRGSSRRQMNLKRRRHADYGSHTHAVYSMDYLNIDRDLEEVVMQQRQLAEPKERNFILSNLFWSPRFEI